MTSSSVMNSINLPGRRKKVHVLGIVLMFITTLILILQSRILSQETNELIKTQLNKLNHFDFLSTKIFKSQSKDDDIDTFSKESEFNKKVHQMYLKKMDSDVENKYWISNTVLDSNDLELQIPHYFYDSSIQQKDRPPIQPFDPRFTLAVYYHHILHSLLANKDATVQAPFHWYDWVDLSLLNKYLLAPENEKPDCSFLDAREDNKKREEDAKDPTEFCKNNLELPYNHDAGNKIFPGFNVFGPTGRTTSDKGILNGKSYLYSYAPAPFNIIFLTKDSSYNVKTTTRTKLLDSDLVDNYIADTNKHTINLHEKVHALTKKYPPSKDEVINDHEVTIPEKSFEFPYQSIVKDYDVSLHSGKKLTGVELNYYQSLKYSIDAVEKGGPPKYFSEARLYGTLLGDHYDWRFYNGIMYGTYEQTLVLHRLVRSFLSFCRKNGITTWVAHGSLLSWYWNGIAFPWDNDIDVQMPIMDLHTLSMKFNQSLIVEDVEDGFGRYFLDCGSFITLREKGNGNNNIDARFIDVDTGLYIDITGLAISNTSPPQRYKDKLPKDFQMNENEWIKANKELKIFNCRNNHFSSLQELSPVVKTYVEGEVGYIPKKYSDILAVEYSKGLLNKKFSGHIFVPQLRLWIKEEDLYYFLNDRKNWVKYHSYTEAYSKAMAAGEVDDDHFDASTYELTEEQKAALKEKAAAMEKSGSDAHVEKLELNDDDLLTVLKLSYDDLIDFLKKDELLMDYVTTRELTALHEEEIMKMLFGKSTESIVNSAPDFKPIKLDPFLYRIKNDYVDFEDEVAKYDELLEAYKITQAIQADQEFKETGKIVDPLKEKEEDE